VKQSNYQPLGDVIRQLLKEYRLDTQLNENRLKASWEKVLGKLVANHTVSLSVKNRILFVRLDSAALRNELNYSRENIVKALNSEVNADVIEDVVFN
jgi:predicted nucleic acid-binding Zn ribbon protein